MNALRKAARVIVSKLDPDLPDCLPILGYGLINKVQTVATPHRLSAETEIAELHLPSLLSRILLAIALEFESKSLLSLAICANVVRVLNREGVPVRDLPALSGVSKEAIQMAFGILTRARLAVVETSPDRKRPSKIARLTEAGIEVRDEYPLLLDAIEKRWQGQFGAAPVRALREAAEGLAGSPEDLKPLLLQSIAAYPDGWRAVVRTPQTLPHFPMVLHRGGYPDGS